jgi:hypothetical protein
VLFHGHQQLQTMCRFEQGVGRARARPRV